MTFTTISDNDKIIDWNKWHFNRFLIHVCLTGIKKFENKFFFVPLTGDPISGIGDRIGDEITLKGVSFNMMIELNEWYSDVTFKMMLIRSVKSDTTSRSTLFKGQSTNKMLDGINTERFSILFSKTFKITTPNQGSYGPQYIVESVGVSGLYDNSTVPTLSRVTKIVNVWIPGTKFVAGDLIKYDQLY